MPNYRNHIFTGKLVFATNTLMARGVCWADRADPELRYPACESWIALYLVTLGCISKRRCMSSQSQTPCRLRSASLSKARTPRWWSSWRKAIARPPVWSCAEQPILSLQVHDDLYSHDASALDKPGARSWELSNSVWVNPTLAIGCGIRGVRGVKGLGYSGEHCGRTGTSSRSGMPATSLGYIWSSKANTMWEKLDWMKLSKAALSWAKLDCGWVYGSAMAGL